MPDPVETVTTPATPPQAPMSFAEHYEAAKSAAEPEGKAEETAAPASDDTKTEDTPPPAEDTKADDQPKETAEPEDQLLPADEIAKLSPKEKTAYQKAQANYTQKTQKLATDRKELEQWKPLIDGLSQNPDATMEELAKARGYKLVKTDAVQDTTAQVTTTGLEQALAEVPEDVRPLFEAFGKKLIDSVKGDFKKEMEPIKETHRQNEIESIQKQTDSVLEAFTAKHSDWKKHEPKMLEIARDFQPSGKTDEFKYMESLLTLATANISEAEKTKKVVDKINKSAAKAEEPVQPTSEKLVTHALPAPGRRELRDAYEAAKRGEVWQK